LAADLNQDGLLDLISVGGVPVPSFPPVPVDSPSLTAWMNQGNGAFAVGAPFGWFNSTSLGSPTLGDFDGDKAPDILVPDISNSSMKLMIGNNDGTFKPAQEYGWGQTSPTAAAAANFNKDPHLDVAILGTADLRVILSTPCLIDSPVYFERKGCAAAESVWPLGLAALALFAARRTRRSSIADLFRKS
jgi:MYXO-CTERM domain-containing protein